MTLTNNKYHRRSIRLRDYDYSQAGTYYITICTQNRVSLFGNITDSKIVLNDAGTMVEKWWLELPQKFQDIALDEYIIMPNHFHGIIIINNNNVGVPLVGTQNTGNIISDKADTRPAPTIGDIIGVFKSMTTNEYIHNIRENEWKPFNGKLWQRNYYEHIIRDETDLNRIREYIINNPANWKIDENFA